MIVSLLIVKLAVVAWLYWRERSLRLHAQAASEHHLASFYTVQRELFSVQRERDDAARDLRLALTRLAEIRDTITRRPPRRRWLRMAHRVANLSDMQWRAFRGVA